MPRGGTRLGAGRPPGSLTSRTREIAEKLAEAGATPLEVMITTMRHYVELGMLDRACEFAVMAAPYMHPRLASVQQRSEVEMQVRSVVSDQPMAEEELVAAFCTPKSNSSN